MFAPKRGHVTHCVARDVQTFLPFIVRVVLRCRRLVENKSSRKFTVFVVLKVREIARNKFFYLLYFFCDFLWNLFSR